MAPTPNPRPLTLPLPMAADPRTPANAVPTDSRSNPVTFGYHTLRLRADAPIARTIRTLERDTGLPYATCQRILSRREDQQEISCYALATIAYMYDLPLDRIAYIELVGTHLPDAPQTHPKPGQFQAQGQTRPKSGTPTAIPTQTRDADPNPNPGQFRDARAALVEKMAADYANERGTGKRKAWRDFTPTAEPQPLELDPRQHEYIPNPFHTKPGRNDENDANRESIRDRAAFVYRELIVNSIHNLTNKPNKPWNDYTVEPPFRTPWALQNEAQRNTFTPEKPQGDPATRELGKLIDARIRYEFGMSDKQIMDNRDDTLSTRIQARRTEILHTLGTGGWGGVPPLSNHYVRITWPDQSTQDDADVPPQDWTDEPGAADMALPDYDDMAANADTTAAWLQAAAEGADQIVEQAFDKPKAKSKKKKAKKS